MGKEKYQEHHIIPVSLGGGDRLANRKIILQKDHEKIHDTLSLKFKAIRVLRMQECEASLESDWKKYFEAQKSAQIQYFHKIDQLSTRLGNLHYESIRESIIDILSLISEKRNIITQMHSEPQGEEIIQVPVKIEKIYSSDINFGLDNLAKAKYNLNMLNEILKILKNKY